LPPVQVCKQTIAARRSLAHEWKIFKDLVGNNLITIFGLPSVNI
jgi:hypothetical protein